MARVGAAGLLSRSPAPATKAHGTKAGSQQDTHNQTHGAMASAQNTSRSARRVAKDRRARRLHGEVVAKARWGAAG
jgi:hypothetical protein